MVIYYGVNKETVYNYLNTRSTAKQTPEVAIVLDGVNSNKDISRPLQVETNVYSLSSHDTIISTLQVPIWQLNYSLEHAE